MVKWIRAWWEGRSRRSERERELDRELAAEEAALLDDPDGLGTELQDAEMGVLWRRRRLPHEEQDHSD